MDAPTTDLVRARRDTIEFRAEAEGDSLGVLTGHVITWNDWYEVNSVFEGNFMETVSPGAARKTVSENRSGIKSLFDHGHDPSMGNKVLGPFRDLDEDNIGLLYAIDLFDTSYNRDLLPGLKAGVYGSSHRFRVVKDEWVDAPERSERNPEGIPERTIRELALFELGPVTFPANPKSTAGVRSVSMTDEWRARHFTISATPDREPAPTTTVQEPQVHSGMSPDEREFALRAFLLRGAP